MCRYRRVTIVTKLSKSVASIQTRSKHREYSMMNLLFHRLRPSREEQSWAVEEPVGTQVARMARLPPQE